MQGPELLHQSRWIFARKKFISFFQFISVFNIFWNSMMEMLSQFQYCPPNVTVHDFWWNYGISHCALDTISSLALAGFIVVFGSIEILAYRMYGTLIEDLSRIPSSKLYHVQILLLTLASFSSFIKYVLESYLFPDSTIYGYTVKSWEWPLKNHWMLNFSLIDF